MHTRATSFFSAGDPQQQINPIVTALTSTEALGQAVDASGFPQALAAHAAFTSTITWFYPLKQNATSTQLDGLGAALSSLSLPSAQARPDRLTLATLNTPVAALQAYQ